jgi:glucose/arabinose dehydrogenase
MRLLLLQSFVIFVGSLVLSWTTVSAATLSTFPRAREGWTLQLIAEAPNVRHPSVVCAAPDGRVFVAEDPMDISSPHAHLEEGRIVCLQTDGRTTMFATNLHAVFGLQYLEGKLYVLHNPKFSVFTDDNGVGRDRVDLIEQTNPDPWALDWNDHVPANFRLAMDGYFYIAVGDKGLFGAVDRSGRRVDLHGGGVVRIRPDGTGLEVLCSGVRNILDVAINDEDELFTYDNTDEHQWMGRLTHMVDGGFYGYPFDFIPRRPYTLWMFADFGPGAATGELSWNDDSLPVDWRGNLILADFGQRNLRRVRLARDGATFRAVADELLFPDPPADFRPVGITETTEGSGFFICDWQHADNKEGVAVGRLWKLTANLATNIAPKPLWYLPAALGQPSNASIEDLIGGLAHPRKSVRLTAQSAVSRRGAVAIPPLTRVLIDPAAPENARWHALWALDQIDGGVAARPEILALAGAPEAAVPVSVRRQAIHQLTQRQVRDAVPVLIQSVRDPNASVRFHAATALRRLGDPRAVSALLGALAERDPFVRFAVFTALNHLGRAHLDLWPRLVRALDTSDAFARESVSFGLRETFDSDLVKVLVEAAADQSRPVPARELALRLTAAVHHQPPAWKGDWWAYHPALSQRPARTVDWSSTALVLATLRDRLNDAELALRLAAVEGLRQARDTESAADLRERFTLESNGPMRMALLTTLGDFTDAASTPMLADLLRNRPPIPRC